jgi:hypothetical protein
MSTLKQDIQYRRRENARVTQDGTEGKQDKKRKKDKQRKFAEQDEEKLK